MDITVGQELMSHSNSKIENLMRTMQMGVAGLSPAAVAQPRAHASPCAVPQGKAGQVHRLMLLVEERFGIHPSGPVERKLERVFENLPEDALRAWVDQLAMLPSGDSEWLSLVETLTVHETYFCRDKPMMWMLAGDVLPMLIHDKKRSGDYALKLWSAGCSTGEETYNIAMLVLQALAEMGEALEAADGEIRPNPRWRLDILGTDVSRQVVRTANSAVYADFGMGSFRDLPDSRKKFFELEADVHDRLPGVEYFRVRQFVRRWVTFRQHNLLSGAPPETGRDLVICRNVMIYFQDEVKRQVQELFHQALRPGGVLLLGGTDVQFWPERYERRYSDGGAWYVRE
jgi:chemotaxis protein methyltransferase CheR